MAHILICKQAYEPVQVFEPSITVKQPLISKGLYFMRHMCKVKS